MRTVYVIVHDGTYAKNGGTPKISSERKEDAEVMLDIFKGTSSGELRIVEVPLQTASTVIFQNWPSPIDGDGYDEPRVVTHGGTVLP